MRRFLLPLTALALLVSCGPSQYPSEPVTTVDSNEVIPVEPDGGIGDGAGPIPEKPSDIPARFRGVWFGLESVCKDYAEMRIEILPAAIRFYESEGQLKTITRTQEDKLRINLDMSGEGETWESTSDWSLTENSRVLIRQDVGENGYPDPIRYRRCPA